MHVAEAAERVRELRSRIENRWPGLLGEFDVDAYIGQLDASVAEGSYKEWTPQVRAVEGAVREKAGAHGCDEYHKLVLATLVTQYPQRLETRRIPASVREVFESELVRILNDMDTSPYGPYEHSNDVFRKDLCSCLFRMYPCGAQVVDTVGGVSRAPIFRGGGLSQAVRAARYFAFETRGFSPFYEIHTHTPTLSEFNADGWDRCYFLIADLLELNPEIKGITGASWFYDPQLEEVSPRLSYLRHRPVEGGGRFFRIGHTEGSKRDALATSKTRRRLFDEGKYIPTHWQLVWQREDMIAWARTERSRAQAGAAGSQ